MQYYSLQTFRSRKLTAVAHTTTLGKHKDSTSCTLDTGHMRCSKKNKLSLHRAGSLPPRYLQNLSVFTAQRMSNRSCAVFPVMALS